MKAMKHILIVIGLMSVITLTAQTVIEYPVAQMHSTSVMAESGSSLPNAAITGFVLADDNLNGASDNAPRGPRRIGGGNSGGGTGPENPDDVWANPIGDIPWLFMLLLAIGYAIYLRRKNSIPTRDSRNKQ